MPVSIRAAAIDAVVAAGTPAQVESLIDWLMADVPLDRLLVEHLVFDLFPRKMDVATLLQLLEGLEPRERMVGYDRIGHLLASEVSHRCTPQQRYEIIQWVVGRFEDSRHGTSNDGSADWLLAPLARLVADGLQAHQDEELDGACHLSRSLTWLIRRRRGHGFDEPYLEPLDSLFPTHPALRRYVFWTWVAEETRRRDRVPRTCWRWNADHIYDLEEQDTGWLLEDVATREDPDEQLLAFVTACDVGPFSTRSEDHRTRLGALAARDDRFQAYHDQWSSPPVASPRPERWQLRELASRRLRRHSHERLHRLEERGLFRSFRDRQVADVGPPPRGEHHARRSRQLGDRPPLHPDPSGGGLRGPLSEIRELR